MRSQRFDDGRAAIGFQWRNVHTRLTRRRPPRKIVSGKKHETHSVFRRQHGSTDRNRREFTSSTRVRSDRNRYIYSLARFSRSTISNDRASRKTYNIVINYYYSYYRLLFYYYRCSAAADLFVWNTMSVNGMNKTARLLCRFVQSYVLRRYTCSVIPVICECVVPYRYELAVVRRGVCSNSEWWGGGERRRGFGE